LAKGDRCLGVAVVDPSELVCKYPTTGYLTQLVDPPRLSRSFRIETTVGKLSVGDAVVRFWVRALASPIEPLTNAKEKPRERDP
jgi:hypothetical protein